MSGSRPRGPWGGIGPEAKAAVPALIESLKEAEKSGNELVWNATDNALRKITEGESGDREDAAGPPGLGESDPGR